MERIPKGLYTPEFRAEAVMLVEATGMSVARAAKQLSVPKSSLDNWVRASRAGKLSDVGKGVRLPSDVELELARIRKELAARTRAYVDRRAKEGMSKKEIHRCLKRYIVRELYPLILADLANSRTAQLT